MPRKRPTKDPAAKHNPSAAERDERVTVPEDVEPEELLAALLEVDPESEPVKKD